MPFSLKGSIKYLVRQRSSSKIESANYVRVVPQTVLPVTKELQIKPQDESQFLRNLKKFAKVSYL
jgi:hypothetical protein